MPYLLAIIIGEEFFSFVKKGVYVALITSFLIAVLTMWGSFFVMFLYFFDIMQNFLNDISSVGSSSSDLVSKMFGVLNCIGFIDAFNDTKSVWLSSISFLFGRILFTKTIQAYNLFLSSIKPLLTR